jgi:glutathione peroxidase
MTTLHDFSLTDIDGNSKNLGDFAGKVVLLVNVASRCGYTSQYRGLEKLHEELGPRGVVVLGFPSNDFGAQEPGTDAEIKAFCTTQYDVKFPMFSKITVKGGTRHPLYAWLTTEAQPAGEVKWNFEKFLVGKDGKVIARFGSGVTPEDGDLRGAIERALAG